MQKCLIQRCFTLLSLGIAVAGFFAGCHFFEPGIADNQEPRIENTYDNDEPAEPRTSKK